VNALGPIIGCAIVVIVTATIWWMVHPPRSKAERAASVAQADVAEMVGSIIVVFSQEIHSEHMMVLASRLARRQDAELRVIYIIEVPRTLPLDALTPLEDREAFDVLATAEAIAQRNGAHLVTETVHARNVSQAALEVAKREGASLLVIGAYKEGKYSGAPLGRDIEAIASNAKCDVIIGVPGRHGSLLETGKVDGANGKI
jgi:nucleotide-binding universal stress UspA family protein